VLELLNIPDIPAAAIIEIIAKAIPNPFIYYIKIIKLFFIVLLFYSNCVFTMLS
jgi:hypothetical protein